MLAIREIGYAFEYKEVLAVMQNLERKIGY